MIWLNAATELGLEVVRSSEVFAAYDGAGTLTIAEDQFFDPDDCLAQMIFHEVCHWLVAGRRGDRLVDWGLSNVDDRDLIYEHAAIRVQMALATPFGLRDFMAVTTDWRPYWDDLPYDPIRDGDDPAIPLAQEAFYLARKPPFDTALTRALSATATIADAIRDFVLPTSLWSQTRARHRLGSLLSITPEQICGDCVWAVQSKPTASGKPRISCRQHKEAGQAAPTVRAEERACDRWEPVFTIDDCGQCGACCRQGFDVLEVSPRDPFRKLHPELVELQGGEYRVPRPNGFCVALDGDGNEQPYRCRHYATRPRNCADFEVAGDACLIARRRVGLSR